MNPFRLTIAIGWGLIVLGSSVSARAADLYQHSNCVGLASDHRACQVGDVLTVVIFQVAEATNSAQNNSRKNTDVSGSVQAGSFDESAKLDFGGGFTGRGEVRRSERLVAQLTVTIQSVLPNGDFLVSGEQLMRINGETTRIGVRGRVRPADITRDNTLLSSRIADAQINYDGKGFVSRSARPGLLNRIFSFLGLG